MQVAQAPACDVERVRGARPRAATISAWLIILLAGLIPLVGRAVLIPVLGIPQPAIQDEFSYLLASDTFAHGRLANPTPHHAEHFETLQELLHPTYASKYPPFSSVAMAFGQRIFGEPWIGVWLGMGRAVRDALLVATGLDASDVGNCGHAGRGGTDRNRQLLDRNILGRDLGCDWRRASDRALPAPDSRLLAQSMQWLLAAGLGILANTRPYEGLLLAVVCLGYLTVVFVRRRVGLTLILPMALLLLPVFAWMGYYNYRVTGRALEMPYAAYDKQYTVWSPWMWQTQPRPTPTYTSAALRDFWVVAFEAEYQFARQHLLKTRVSDLLGLARFFLGWPIVVCLLAFALPLWRNRRARLAVLLGALFYAGCAMDARLFPHYAAPGTALVYVLAGLAVKTAWRSAAGSPVERRLLAAGLVALFLVTTAVGLFTPKNRFYFSATDYHVKAKRALTEDRLRHEPGDHLVLVQYGPGHDPWEELVYNGADIDGSRVVWARSLGIEKDSDLIRYYSKRTVWLLEEDGAVKLKRYLASTESTTPTHLE